MKKFGLLILSFVFAGCLALSAHARVVFLPGDGSTSVGDARSGGADNGATCEALGYTRNRQSCGEGRVAIDACPRDSSYIKHCCPEGYTHTKDECTQLGLTYSLTTCDGIYHRCEEALQQQQ